MPEHGWINCSDYAKVLNMSWKSYNNIVTIVTNVIILEFLYRFVDPGALLPFYLLT